MRVLITGGSGAIGQKVLELLTLDDNFDLVAFDVKNKRTERFYRVYENKIELHFGDLSRRDDVQELCLGIDAVIHLAAIIPPLADEQPNLANAVNVEGTRNLVRCLETYTQDTFILYASSVSVYGDRLKNPLINVEDPVKPSLGDEYAKTKILAEQIIMKSELDWSIFRLSAIMGTGNHKMSPLLFHMPLKTPMEITTPEDTARAFIRALTKKHLLDKKVFNLGGGKHCRISYQDFLSKSFSIYGLGPLDFPEHSFAEKNFHCGYYGDGEELEKILHFRRDSINDYFKLLEKSIPPMQKVITSLFSRFIKKRLAKKSAPLQAFESKDKVNMERFFEIADVQRN